MAEFEPFPKLARLSRECTITEKIDGTNAQVYIEALPLQDCAYDPETGANSCITIPTGDDFTIAGDIERGELFKVYAGSRTRLIKPGKTTDNFGFAAWVWENASQLVRLGPGRHFGEWWGKGIQRGYGLSEKRFSLFDPRWHIDAPGCCHVVPVLYTGDFDGFMGHLPDVMENLKAGGSQAAPGFMNPEGIVIWHSAARVAFKKTFEKDATGKDA